MYSLIEKDRVSGTISIFGFRIGEGRDSHCFNRVHSRRDFIRLLDHERSRADRSGREFSLIAFTLPLIARDTRALRHFMKMLAGRIRQTESVGWIQKNDVLGVILPDTPSSGAYKLAHDILSLNGKPCSPPAFTIYTYPSNWLKGNHGQDTTYGDCGPVQDKLSPDAREDREEDAGSNLFFIPGIPLWKRSIDIIGAVTGLVLLSPLFLSIAFLIKTASPGPVFFKQVRAGFLGRRFTCWKFRTMEIEADSTVHQVHVRELYKNGQSLKKLDDQDPRIIPFGRMLRETGLDEVPQLINVLRGEMSLVGPRPDVPYSVAHYLPWHNRRFETYPGLTGLWQVNGKNSTTLDEMMRLDISYVKNRSLRLDAEIVLKTIPAIIQQACGKTPHRDKPVQGR